MHTEAEKNSAVISSDRVEGTAVFDRGGKNIGHVDYVLIEKRGGQATEAVLSVGGFLGMGDEKHCVPWSKLDYDTDLGGYTKTVEREDETLRSTFVLAIVLVGLIGLAVGPVLWGVTRLE